MTDWTLTSKSNEARKRAITNEFDRLIKELMALNVLRHSMLPGMYVIYTEQGPMDLNLKRLAPCVKIYPGNCLCYECDTNG